MRRLPVRRWACARPGCCEARPPGRALADGRAPLLARQKSLYRLLRDPVVPARQAPGTPTGRATYLLTARSCTPSSDAAWAVVNMRSIGRSITANDRSAGQTAQESRRKLVLDGSDAPRAVAIAMQRSLLQSVRPLAGPHRSGRLICGAGAVLAVEPRPVSRLCRSFATLLRELPKLEVRGSRPVRRFPGSWPTRSCEANCAIRLRSGRARPVRDRVES